MWTQHTRSSSTKLTCSSTAAWLSPMRLPNSLFRIRSTAAACSVPCPLTASAKPNVPALASAAMIMRSSSEGEATNQRGLLAECRPQQVSFEAPPASNAMALSLCGLGSLQTSVSPVRISLRHAYVTQSSATHETSNKVSAHFPNHQHWSCLRRRPIAAPKMPQQAWIRHGHLPIDAGAVIGDAGETIFWPGSFV